MMDEEEKETSGSERDEPEDATKTTLIRER